MQTIQIHSRAFDSKLPIQDVLSKPFLDGESEKHEPHLIKFMQLYLKPGDIVMDIGACFGYHTLEMSRQVGKTGKVYVFEPQHDMYDLLRENLHVNECFNATVYNIALGDKEMEVCMYNAYPEGTTNYGDSFISWKYRAENYNVSDDKNHQEMIGKGGGFLPLNKQVVYCKTLDSFSFEHPVKFVKIDVQGFEMMILKGGSKFIDLHRPVMVIEFEDTCMQFHGYSTKEFIQYLQKINYEIIYLEHHYPCDHVCVPREKLYTFFVHFKGKIYPLTESENNPINNNYVNGVRRKLMI